MKNEAAIPLPVGRRTRLPIAAHASRPWRIHELTAGFRVEDVWALATPGARGDFPRLVHLIASGDPSQSGSRATRALWRIRWAIGELLGWDRAGSGEGVGSPTLRDRLPADLRTAPSGPNFTAAPFTPLYLIDDEFAAEIANRTMHGVLHLGWVPDGTGGYRGQMAVLVKANGMLGAAYMSAIRPFRHRVVYPALIRRIEREWRARTGETWLVLYDAECGLCKWLLAWLLRRDRVGRLRPIALQRPEAGELLADLESAERMGSWHLISPAGGRSSGGAAIPALLELLPRGRHAAALIARFPRLVEAGYRWIAERRARLARLVPESAKRRASEQIQQRERMLEKLAADLDRG